MIVDAVANVFRCMAHQEVDAPAVPSGSVKAGFEGMAAFMGDMIHAAS